MDKPFPAYKGSDPYIFVSYSHDDEGDVFAQIRWLQDQGINVWYDATGIGAGSEWNEEIAKAIKGADRFLYFITPSSVASEHCRRELNFAQSEDRQIVVCHLRETALPDGLRLSLDNRQAILKHRLSEDDYRSSLARALSSEVVADFDRAQQTASKGSRRLAIAGVVVAILLVFGIAWWYLGVRFVEQPGSPEAGGEVAIAVLPFANMSDDLDQEYFSEGIAEEILNNLARSTDVVVRPRSSSFRFRESELDSQAIGQRLDVTHVLEGSVRRAEAVIRVRVELTDVRKNQTIWSERFEHVLEDVFAVQTRLLRTSWPN